MFLKCSLDAQNIAALREQSANISEILRAGWVRSAALLKKRPWQNPQENTFAGVSFLIKLQA